MSIHARYGRGSSAIDTVVVLAIAATILTVSASHLQRVLRRARLRGAVQEVYSLVLATRMEAVKRNQPVVLFVDLANRRIVTWADRAPCNYVQDPNEPVINTFNLPPYVYFRSPPAGRVDGEEAVAFDTYDGNASLRDLVVFRGDGTLVAPQSTASQPPARPSLYTSGVPSGSVNCKDGCRGIYIADSPYFGGGNVFRISVDDFGRSGRASLLKWLPESEGGNGGETDFVPPPWRWAN